MLISLWQIKAAVYVNKQIAAIPQYVD